MNLTEKDIMNIGQITRIAMVCHEANRAWSKSGIAPPKKKWSDLDDWQKETIIEGVYFIIQNPNAQPSELHDNWASTMTRNGWVYGDTKDEMKRTHPCILPFEQLPEHEQKKDILFKAIVIALM